MKPISEQFKAFKQKPSREQVDLTLLVFKAKALVMTIEPIVTGAQTEVLERHQFTCNRETRGYDLDAPILEPELSYLLSEADFDVYIRESKAIYEAAGIKEENPEHCPLLIAQNNERKALKALLAAMQTPYFDAAGLDADDAYYSMESLKALQELTLNFMGQFVAQQLEAIE